MGGASFSSTVRPRIACRLGSLVPDCVVATTRSTDAVRLVALGDLMPFTITASTTLDNSSLHEVDVALGGQVAHANHDRAVIVRMADLSTNVVNQGTCNTTPKSDPFQVALWDDGIVIPPNGLNGPQWGWNIGRMSPASNNNTAMVLNNKISPFLFLNADTQFSLTDTALPGTGGPPMSAWGGVSCDFAEWSARTVCAELRGSQSW